jgi:RNA polymerase sigma-70 factor, ECF subfamily
VGEAEERERFEMLYREFAPVVLGYCLRRAPRDVAEDVAAETFTVAWRRAGAVPREALPWLLGVARNLLRSHYRGDARQRDLRDRLAAAGEPVAASREAAGVLEALRTLPERDREALMLAAWDGLRAREAAAVLGCSEVAFRLRLHRARKRLAVALELQEDGPAERGNVPAEEGVS